MQQPIRYTLPKGGHLYKFPDSPLLFPSVTTILDATDTEEERERWKQWRAKPSNMKRLLSSRRRGTLLHLMIEQYLQRIGFNFSPIDPPVSQQEILEAMGFWRGFKQYLNQIEAVVSLEQIVRNSEYKYAGTVDAILLRRGQKVIADWKTTERLNRDPAWNERYCLQVAAYSLCLRDISFGEIVFSTPWGQLNVFQVDLGEWRDRWLHRLSGFDWGQFQDLTEATEPPQTKSFSSFSGLLGGTNHDQPKQR